MTAKVRAAVGDDALFVNVLTFSETVGAALLALGDGDAVALAGALKPTAWIDREGNARPSLDVIAAHVLTVYHLKRRREAVRLAEAGAEAATHAHLKPAEGQATGRAGGDELNNGANHPWLIRVTHEGASDPNTLHR